MSEDANQAIMKRYKDAYFSANGCIVSISYERGWFTIQSGTKRRRKDVENMCAVLERRHADAVSKLEAEKADAARKDGK